MTIENEIKELRYLAQGDAARADANGVDLNPYSTHGTRSLWQAGFSDLPMPQPNQVGSYNWRAWERGRQARILVNEKTS